MKPPRKSANARYSRQHSGVTMVKPLYTAPLAESSRARSAVVGKLLLMDAQVEIVPSSVAKTNCAGVPRTRKSSTTGLNTTPAGLAARILPEGTGTVTVPGRSEAPETSNTLALPRLLSAIQKESPGKSPTPQGFSNNGSMCEAVPTVSETRLVCSNPPPPGIII